MKQWFETLDDDIWFPSDEAGVQEVEFIRRVLRLRRGHQVLDAPCGAGRIAVPLAKAGCCVTGVDRNKRFIDRAGAQFQRERLTGTFAVNDLRQIDFSATFHGDPNAGAHAAFSIIAALIARERTGRGQFIEISQSEAVAHHVSYGFMDYSLNRRVQEAPGNRDPSMAPCGLFPARGEDAWIAIAVPGDEAFGALATELGLPGLAVDPGFATVVARKRNEDALEELVAGATVDRTPAEWMTRLQAVGVPAAIVYHQPDMFDDPQLVAREFFAEIGHPVIGPYLYPGVMAKLARGPADLETPAPTLGQHNEEILQGLLGVDDARYQQLIDDEVIGTVYLESAR